MQAPTHSVIGPPLIMNSSLNVTLAQYSSKGCKSINQDAHGAVIPSNSLCTSKGIALALADGISSSDISHIASHLAVRAFLADYFSTPESWSVRQSVQRVLAATNSWLHSQTKRNTHNQDRGYVCTIAALVIKSTTAHVFHVGDSRVGRIRNNSLEWLTTDHRIQVSRSQSYLSRALGVNAHLEIEYQRHDIQEGDFLLLSTDGVHDYVSSSFICQTLHHEDLDCAAEVIANEALVNGSTDNLTIQLLRINTLSADGLTDIRWQSGRLPLPPSFHTGMLLDSYKLINPLHASHRSHVWLAHDTLNNHQVVIKTPSIDMLSDSRFLESFLTEEWIAKMVNNPHVLKAYGETHRRLSLYSVSEYIEGQTLTQWMTKNPRPNLDTVRGITDQIVTGLRSLHRKSIIHQDIRPDNIIINQTGKITLIDFGSALVAGLSEIGSLPAFAGTEQYSAPEHFIGEPSTWQSDLFSVGTITYQMLTGHLPYGTRVASIRNHSELNTLEYQSALEHNADLPTWLDGVLSKAVHPLAEKRHSALSEFIFDLHHPPTFYQKPTPRFLEKNPAFFWQIACIFLFLYCLYLLAN